MPVENIPISQLPEASTVANSDVLAIDDGITSYRISVENFNATASASARSYAEAAADSASAASNSASDALGYKNTVESALNDASTIVSNAQTYANAAETSKNYASGYASDASTSASQASRSAGEAASYATGVQAYAIEAKSYSQGGTGTRVDEETTNCLYYSNAAHTSEINAASSESNAATSESNAASSESNASASASSASTNALKAEGFAVGTQNGTPAASGDPYYEDNAKYYKEEAADSATNAASSEYNAGLSESAASASESAAKESEEDSEAWAWGKIDGVDIPATHPAYHNNAKYWADAASGGVSGVASFNGRSGIVVPSSGDYAANIIEYDSDDSGLTATDVNSAIDEVHGEVVTLESSLATVATTGVYSDLSGKPSLGTAAAKNSTGSVTQNSTDLIESGAVYSGLALKANTSDLGTAAGKNSTSEVTQSSTALVESGAVYSEVSSLNEDKADKVSSATNGNFAGLDANGNLTDSGSKASDFLSSSYLETSSKTTVDGIDTFTFSSPSITATSGFDPFSDVFGAPIVDMELSGNQLSVSYNSSDNVGTCRLYIR